MFRKAAMRISDLCILVLVAHSCIFADCTRFAFATGNTPMNLRGGSATAEASEAPEKVETCDAAKKAASVAENYVKEQLDFWNSLTPEQVMRRPNFFD